MPIIRLSLSKRTHRKCKQICTIWIDTIIVKIGENTPFHPGMLQFDTICRLFFHNMILCYIFLSLLTEFRFGCEFFLRSGTYAFGFTRWMTKRKRARQASNTKLWSAFYHFHAVARIFMSTLSRSSLSLLCLDVLRSEFKPFKQQRVSLFIPLFLWMN